MRDLSYVDTRRVDPYVRRASGGWRSKARTSRTEPLDDRVIDGALVALWKKDEKGNRELVEGGLIEKLVDAMQPFVAEESDDVDASMRRARRWLYPVEALREAIVNALAHRDWTRYEEIEVARYADRLEVLSPGRTAELDDGGKDDCRPAISAQSVDCRGAA